ncbi:putative branched-subunit amino acid permease [Neorhizobium huautlense]|uniref:Branched-subunit amino acid permease n=1 Tax=Neorhizobium huautlense TaxID=67774 RepID=A0ABT9PRJ1_9HYPH|nr:AzlC family ABC transporter permease [Neorhizobium huautlense]MDP9836811.1 putative branched-subunit amino acid permease [Neorhizobium huautlense]
MNRHEQLTNGLKKGAVVALSSAPFGVLFGAIAVDNGFSITEAALMSGLVYGGASQLVGIELFGHHVAAWIIVLSILAVNFRHVLYSAALATVIGRYPHVERWLAFFLLVDPQFAETVKREEAGKTATFRWYFAMGAVVWVSWVLTTIVGAYFGRMIGDPKAYGIDVLLPVYFLGLTMGFRSRHNFFPVMLAGGIGSVIAFHFIGSPWHISVGAVLGILVATILPPPKAHEEPDVSEMEKEAM